MNTTHSNKKGSVLPLIAVSVSLFFIMLSMSIDLGWIYLTQNQLQNTADAAALAAAAQLIDEDILSGNPNQTDDIVASRDFAEMYAAMNQAGKRSIMLDRNDTNDPDGDVLAGFIENPNDYQSAFVSANVSLYNSVKVRSRLTRTMNGPLGLFFGAFTGVSEVELSAQSVASIEDRVIGFEIPAGSGLRLEILPFAIYVDSWKVQTDGENYDTTLNCPPENDLDHFAFNTTTGQVQYCSSDGIPEVKVFPFKEDVCTVSGLAGNFGTVDIGPANNSTADLVEQIVNGISENDLNTIGGLLMTDDGSGVFSKWLNGDTGVSNGIKSAMNSIIGQPRLLPLFQNAIGQGNNAMYEIVAFVGVRVMEVRLTGRLSRRKVIVQPCQMISPLAVVDPSAPHSGYVYMQGLTR